MPPPPNHRGQHFHAKDTFTAKDKWNLSQLSTKCPPTNARTAVVTASLGKHLKDTLPEETAADVDVMSMSGTRLSVLQEGIKQQVHNKDLVVIIAGGNDTQQSTNSQVIQKLDETIDVIKMYNPKAKIVVSEISPRGCDDLVNERIDDLNVWIRNRSCKGDNVFWAITCPTQWSMFSFHDKSHTHFNSIGQQYLASNVHNVISNFQPYFVPSRT